MGCIAGVERRGAFIDGTIGDDEDDEEEEEVELSSSNTFIGRLVVFACWGCRGGRVG